MVMVWFISILFVSLFVLLFWLGIRRLRENDSGTTELAHGEDIFLPPEDNPPSGIVPSGVSWFVSEKEQREMRRKKGKFKWKNGK